MQHHLAEVGVDPDFKLSFPQGVLQRLADFHLAGTNDQSRVKRPPKDRLVFVVPREDAVGIGHDEALGREVAAKGQKAISVGVVNRWEKAIVVVELINHGAKVQNNSVFLRVQKTQRDASVFHPHGLQR